MSKKERKKENDFDQRLEILALSLSLKENDRLSFPNGYESLFSMYIKMFQKDQDAFFIDNERKPNIIASLERSRQAYRLDKVDEFRELLMNMKHDDPTDFIICPIDFCVSDDVQDAAHVCGLTFYRKTDHLLAIKVDKEKFFDQSVVSYVHIPITKIKELSEILFIERGYINLNVFAILRKIEAISEQFQSLPMIEMKRQMAGNCIISEVEAALKVALFNCHTSLFSLTANERVTPKWNRNREHSILEMRKRFLEAVKGDNQVWNSQFDYLFDYYLYRKGVSSQTSILHINKQTEWWYVMIQKVFKMDPYISVLWDSKGKLPLLDDERIEKIVDEMVKSLNKSNNGDIQDLDEHELCIRLKQEGRLLSIFEERIALTTLPLAKKMNERLISRMNERYKETYEEMRKHVVRRSGEEMNIRTSHWFIQFLENTLPTKVTQYFHSNQIDEQQINEFERRMDMLALTFSLKPNIDSFVTPQNYELLISIYIKMLKHDSDHFFIDKNRQPKIIQSLSRLLELYQLDQPKKLEVMLENLRNNDPTDFLLFPVNYFMLNPEQRGHVCGLTIYKKDEQFVVIQVDKSELIGAGAVSYVRLPLKKAEELSEIFFSTRELTNFRPYETLMAIEAISHKFKAIPAVELARQTTANCGVSEIEASLKIILFNCKKDLFKLPEQLMITPKWNMEHPESTLEMRTRFLKAVKGNNKEWNQNFDYLFDYYLYRKMICKKVEQANVSERKYLVYQNVRNLYHADLYIPVLLSSKGHIPAKFDEQLKKKITEFFEPSGELYGENLENALLSDLNESLQKNTNKIDLMKERLPFIQLPIAKEISEYTMVCIQKKMCEVKREIRRRQRIEHASQKKCIYRETKEKLDEPFIISMSDSPQPKHQWIRLPYYGSIAQQTREIPSTARNFERSSESKKRLPSLLHRIGQVAEVTNICADGKQIAHRSTGVREQ